MHMQCISCKQYAIFSLHQDDGTHIGYEECYQYKDFTITYMSDKDITYFHPLHDSGHINTLNTKFLYKIILFQLAGNFLLKADEELDIIIQNGLILS